MDNDDAVSAPPASSGSALFQNLAPSVIADVGESGFREWLRLNHPTANWTNTRNLHECEVLAEALDALVLDQNTELAVSS